jgi:hypothetical protein
LQFGIEVMSSSRLFKTDMETYLSSVPAVSQLSAGSTLRMRQHCVLAGMWDWRSGMVWEVTAVDSRDRL